MLRIDDADRVRTITFDRPDALNAFNEALYDATTEALIDAAADPDVAVVVITGTGRSFSAGTEQLGSFPKPLLCAVNGMALGIGATMLGFADLVLMSTEARVRCPFTDLAVAPEAASSYTFPLLLGRQHATWALMSSEWIPAAECERIGLAWRVTEPDRLLEETHEVARHLAAKPLASLIETKRTITAGHRDAIAAARKREDQAFVRLLGRPANLEAFTALGERRAPDFARVDTEHPVDVQLHST
jgi:enoyl-CoA hydratase/carnithine racemase